MILSTQTDILGSRFGDQKAIEILARAGFDAYDFSFFKMKNDENYELNSKNYLEYAKKLRKVADKAGIKCNQAHAPFPSSVGDKQQDKIIFDKIVRAMEVAALLGAETIVVHPIKHMRYLGNEAELFELNMAFYKSLIPYCAKFGIKVATENMWERVPGTNKITHAPCSRGQEFCRYIDALDSRWIVGCLDIGHVSLVDEQLYDTIITLGHNRLQALHVHDNDYLSDTHTLPFMSKMDFEPFIKGLSDIDYTGDMTLEADNFIRRVPDGLIDTAVKYMEQTGRYIISEIAKIKFK